MPKSAVNTLSGVVRGVFKRWRCLLLFGFFMPVALCRHAYAQLCNGSLGDPVVKITFGAGTATHAGALSGTTSYTYSSADFPQDGSYTVENSTAGSGSVWWSTTDHTGDAGGYMMVVNASVAKTDYFYKSTVTGLCPGTTYEFAAWVVNLLRSRDISPPDITFTILTTSGTVLNTINTGSIPLTSGGPVWKQYGVNFTTPAGVSDVVIQMTNNSAGGAPANDLALDDITFRPCGPTMTSSFSSTASVTTQTSCSGSTQAYTLSAQVSTGYTSPVYQWQVNDGTGWANIAGATTTTYTVAAAPANAGSYLYRIVSSEAANAGSVACQVASNVLTLTVIAAPAAAFSITGTSCLRDAEQFTDLSTSQGFAINSWAWNFGDGKTSQAQSPSHTYTAAGDYTVQLTVTNSNGCTATATTQNIHIATKPTAAFIMQPVACAAPLTVAFTDKSIANEGAITSWLWDFNDGSTSTDKSPVHTFATAQAYTVSLTVVTDKNCTGSSTTSETINFTPVVSFTLPDVCQADGQSPFVSTSTVGDMATDPLTYQWDFGDNYATAINSNNATGKSVSHHFSQVGLYTIKLTVTTAYGCVQSVTKQLSVNGNSPTAAFALTGTAPLCSNTPVSFVTNAEIKAFGNGDITRFVMDFGDGTAPQTYRLTKGGIFTHKYPTTYTTTPVSYTVVMTAYSGTSAVCSNIAMQTILVNGVPKPTFTLPAQTCLNTGTLKLSDYVTELSGAPAGTPAFSIDGKAQADGLFNTLTVGAGKHAVTCYYIAGTTMCTDTTTDSITVNPIATISAGPKLRILAGGSIRIKATSTGGNAVTYSWSPAAGLGNPTSLNPTASPTVDTRYTLTATSTTNGLACPVTDTVTVVVLQPPVIPNTFTPNGDLRNDTWNIKNLGSYPNCTVEVFNRNGERVFYSTGYTTPWDGRYQGANLPVGVYYYVVNPKEGRGTVSGSLTLIR